MASFPEVVDRRFFLKLAALGCLELTWPGLGFSAPVPLGGRSKGKVLLCLKPTVPGKSTIRLFDWDSGKFEDFEVPLGLVHSLFQDRADPRVLYVFEIFGSVVRMNLEDHTFVKVDHQSVPDLFNGHGAQSADGKYLACTELTGGRSFLSVRSSKTLELIDRTPGACNNCHQVVALPGSNFFVVGNLRDREGKSQTGGITFYDHAKKEVAVRVDFPFPVLHLLPLSSTEVIGLSLFTKWNGTGTPAALTNDRSSAENIRVFSGGQTFIPGPLYYAKSDGSQKALWDPTQKDLFLDNFGLAGISPQSFLSGHHGSGKVILWKDLKMARVFSVPDAKNLVASADGTEFMALSNQSLKIFSLKTFEEIRLPAKFPEIVTLSSYKA